MASQLGVYNRTLDLLGCRRIASLAEDREPTRVLDANWADVRDYCVTRAMWIFALRSAAAVSAGLPTVDFGFTNAYTRPADCIYTYMLSTNNDFQPILQEAVEVDGFYLTRGATLYVRYTSNDASYGLSLTRWTPTFAEFVAHYFAAVVGYRLTRNFDLVKLLYEVADRILVEARSKDAVTVMPGPIPYNIRNRRELVPGDNPPEPFPFPVVQASSDEE